MSYMEWREFKGVFGPDLEEEAMSLMATFLNHVGTITWFSQPELKSLVVLDPQWLANLMATLVSFTVNWKNGLLSIRDLQLAWKHIPTRLHSTLVKLLEQYEILYPISGGMPHSMSTLLPQAVSNPPSPFLPLASCRKRIVDHSLYVTQDSTA